MSDELLGPGVAEVVGTEGYAPVDAAACVADGYVTTLCSHQIALEQFAREERVLRSVQGHRCDRLVAVVSAAITPLLLAPEPTEEGEGA